ncbi:MAG: AmmeMemoRadiSam system protein B [Candidatus Nanoarchaeia archaeon]|nr:AmmeMemoRadiSam system protein B [Candidatus Nanoarchaeia archaeon]
MRIPIANGQFYANNFEDLKKQIKNCFKSGPGNSKDKRTKKIYGIITPHAGYSYSGKCAAFAYKEIANSIFPKSYIILGVNHTGYFGKKLALSYDDWQTPFGIVKNSKEKISNLKDDIKAHAFEHSIEVQLPFLQFVSKDNLKNLRILPITVSEIDYNYCKDIAKEFPKDSVLIISSDFTHYGSLYNYEPFKENKRENIEKIDMEAIKLIMEFKTKEFLEYCKDKTICGVYGIALGLEILKEMGATKATLLKYYTSGDITNDYNSMVGYASIVFE